MVSELVILVEAHHRILWDDKSLQLANENGMSFESNSIKMKNYFNKFVAFFNVLPDVFGSLLPYNVDWHPAHTLRNTCQYYR